MERLSKVILMGEADVINVNVSEPDYVGVFKLNNITGVGSPPIDLKMASLPTGGSFYTGSRVASRDIIMTLGIRPDYANNKSAMTIRNDLAFILGSGISPVRIEFVLTDEDVSAIRHMYIEGYIANIEVVIFSNKPEVVITFRCPNPSFKDTWTSEFWSSADSMFTAKGSVNAFKGFDLYYAGTLPVGIDIEVENFNSGQIDILTVPRLDRRFNSGSIDSPRYFQIHTTADDYDIPGTGAITLSGKLKDAIPKPSKLKINTRYHERTISLEPTGMPKVNLIPYLYTSSDIKWPVIYPGKNIFLFRDSYAVTPTFPYNVRIKYVREFLTL